MIRSTAYPILLVSIKNYALFELLTGHLKGLTAVRNQSTTFFNSLFWLLKSSPNTLSRIEFPQTVDSSSNFSGYQMSLQLTKTAQEAMYACLGKAQGVIPRTCYTCLQRPFLSTPRKTAAGAPKNLLPTALRILTIWPEKKNGLQVS